MNLTMRSHIPILGLSIGALCGLAVTGALAARVLPMPFMYLAAPGALAVIGSYTPYSHTIWPAFVVNALVYAAIGAALGFYLQSRKERAKQASAA